jgi:hypothetical protein
VLYVFQVKGADKGKVKKEVTVELTKMLEDLESGVKGGNKVLEKISDCSKKGTFEKHKLALEDAIEMSEKDKAEVSYAVKYNKLLDGSTLTLSLAQSLQQRSCAHLQDVQDNGKIARSLSKE